MLRFKDVSVEMMNWNLLSYFLQGALRLLFRYLNVKVNVSLFHLTNLIIDDWAYICQIYQV